MTQEELAGLLFKSLRTKIMTLPDSITVYPAHGAGSACGKNMSKETTDTLGNQKQTNYALRGDMTENEFVHEVTNGLLPPPSYFGMNVSLNKAGYESYETVFNRGMKALSLSEFEELIKDPEVLLLDTRTASDFASSFIPGSISIGLEGQFAPWVGALIPDIKQEILLITEDGREEEVVTRLARVGYDHAIGYLKGGFDAWKAANKEVDSITSISAAQLAEAQKGNPEINIIDVRKGSEHFSEHILGAINAPLDYINESMLMVDKNKTYYVHCAGGYRSMIFTSVLRARGYHNLIDVDGGFKAIKESELFNVSDYVCPSTLL
jgi:rhodanese-related sulfurtransferase